ncbi:MAG: sulfotransferase family protein [Actinomycetota bacterium]
MLPNLLIIGAQKAATSSLHLYLDAHPQIQMSKVKELDFFAGPGWAWDRGLEWYESQLPDAGDVRGESSPSYTSYPLVTGVPQRIKEIIPEAKLIYMVRDPVDRIVSQYMHLVNGGHETRPLPEVVRRPQFPQTGLVMKSRYAMQLDLYYEHFAPDRILVVSQERLQADRRRTMEAVFDFLEVDPAAGHDRPDVRINTAAEKRRPRWVARKFPKVRRRSMRPGVVGTVSRAILTARLDVPTLVPEEVSRIRDLMRDDVAKLRSMTGMPFEEWSV